jgi:predicted NUDIX family NTP pyrophosphohydrolase
LIRGWLAAILAPIMMVPKTSAGLLMYRVRHDRLEVFLAHPGGPFFTRKDDGHWTIPKGIVEPGEDQLAAACREFREETGIEPQGEFVELGSIQQRSGKTVHGWAFRGDWDERQPIRSSLFSMEWPPASGQFHEVPEIDRAEFFGLAEAVRKIKAAQRPFLNRLVAALGDRVSASPPPPPQAARVLAAQDAPPRE